MISLKAILLKEGRIPPDLTATNQEILGWRNFWFTKVRLQFNQAIHNWNRDGVLSDEQLDDFVSLIDDMSELLKSTSRQSNKLLGSGLGPGDFEG